MSGSGSYRGVFGLWVLVDLTQVQSARAFRPWVDYTRVDYKSLAELLKQTFRYGPPTDIRVPDDAIDQTVIHARVGVAPSTGISGSIGCEDFGQILEGQAAMQPGQVIEVRQRWRHLQRYTARDKAPPPMLLPFVGEAADFEDAMIWIDQCHRVLGMMSVAELGLEGMAANVQQQAGRLPENLREGIGDLFGCAFKPFATLTGLSVPMPKAYEL